MTNHDSITQISIAALDHVTGGATEGWYPPAPDASGKVKWLTDKQAGQVWLDRDGSQWKHDGQQWVMRDPQPRWTEWHGAPDNDANWGPFSPVK